MQYSIENDILRLTVDTHGAEPEISVHLSSVLHKFATIFENLFGSAIEIPL